VKIHEFITTKGMQPADRKNLRNQTRQVIFEELTKNLEQENPSK
jgi:1-acyl-sn-glycerol-3-phosphate acyltransferase